jgi:hypothetical protein
MHNPTIELSAFVLGLALFTILRGLRHESLL